MPNATANIKLHHEESTISFPLHFAFRKQIPIIQPPHCVYMLRKGNTHILIFRKISRLVRKILSLSLSRYSLKTLQFNNTENLHLRMEHPEIIRLHKFSTMQQFAFVLALCSVLCLYWCLLTHECRRRSGVSERGKMRKLRSLDNNCSWKLCYYCSCQSPMIMHCVEICLMLETPCSDLAPSQCLLSSLSEKPVENYAGFERLRGKLCKNEKAEA